MLVYNLCSRTSGHQGMVRAGQATSLIYPLFGHLPPSRYKNLEKRSGRHYGPSLPTEAPATPEVLGGPEGVPEPLVQCTAWLEAYFREPAATEGLPLPALHHPVFQQDSFTRQVLWKLLKVVKFGETVSYQQLAALAGNPKAARAVGGAMRSNPVPILIPCHRVVRSDGAIGHYSGGGQAVKEWLLAHEGIPTGQPASKGLGLTGTWLKSSFESTSSEPSGRN